MHNVNVYSILFISDQMVVDDNTLRNFLTLEREIAEAEISNPLKPLDVKAEQLSKTIEDIAILEENLKNLEAKAYVLSQMKTLFYMCVQAPYLGRDLISMCGQCCNICKLFMIITGAS